MTQTEFIKEASKIFRDAVKHGHLSDSPTNDRYVGKYMYMYTDGNQHKFKHIETREYLDVPV